MANLQFPTCRWMLLACLLGVICPSARADEPAPPGGTPATPRELPEREIFVPIDDLRVILLSDVQRVLLTREQYDELAAKVRAAHRTAGVKQPAAVLSAEYAAQVEENRVRITGTLIVSAPDDQWSAVELDLSGVALRSAVLDDKPAALGRNPAGTPILFVRGAGRHVLTLEILAAVETAAAERTLGFQIPTPPATRLRLSVPGDVELKSGAAVMRRHKNEAARTTEFELLPRRGRNDLVLSLNNRQLQKDRVVVVHEVFVDEITSAYERLHLTASLAVLHGATDRFRFALPSGFEVTGCTAPQVARWEVSIAGVETDAEQRVLDVILREPTTETVTLHIAAARSPVPLDAWQLPKLTALDVAGEAVVVGLLLETRLKPAELVPQDLISIDVDVLAQALPATLAQDRDGAPAVTPVAAFYAPRSEYALRGRFETPGSDLRATTNILLTLDDERLQVQGGFALLNAVDKIVSFDFVAPQGWQVTEVTADGGAQLPLETFAGPEGTTRVHIRLPEAIPIGQSRSYYFRAGSTAGWLGQWRQQSLEFPVFQITGASRDLGAIAVRVVADMVVRAADAQRLTPLDANEKGKYGLENVTTQFAYRYEAPPYSLKLEVERRRAPAHGPDVFLPAGGFRAAVGTL